MAVLADTSVQSIVLVDDITLEADLDLDRMISLDLGGANLDLNGYRVIYAAPNIHIHNGIIGNGFFTGSGNNLSLVNVSFGDQIEVAVDLLLVGVTLDGARLLIDGISLEVRETVVLQSDSEIIGTGLENRMTGPGTLVIDKGLQIENMELGLDVVANDDITFAGVTMTESATLTIAAAKVVTLKEGFIIAPQTAITLLGTDEDLHRGMIDTSGIVPATGFITGVVFPQLTTAGFDIAFTLSRDLPFLSEFVLDLSELVTAGARFTSDSKDYSCGGSAGGEGLLFIQADTFIYYSSNSQNKAGDKVIISFADDPQKACLNAGAGGASHRVTVTFPAGATVAFYVRLED